MNIDYTSKIEGDVDVGFDVHFNDELIGHADTTFDATALLDKAVRTHVEAIELAERRQKTIFRVECERNSEIRDTFNIVGKELGFSQYSNEHRGFMNQSSRFELDCRIDRMTNNVYVRAFNGVHLVHETPLKIEDDEDS